MNVEVLIHGVLSGGQSSWKNIDTNYLQGCYIGTPNNVVLKIETIKRSDGVSTYYNYLRYKVNAASGRSGAYFGFTVRVDDVFCCDIKELYNIIDTIFNKQIVGTLLEKNSNGLYKYKINQFKEKDTELKDIEKIFIANFSNRLVGNDFVSLSPNLAKSNEVLRINVREITPQIAKDALKKGQKIHVSPEFPTDDEKKWIAQNEQVRQDAEARIKEIKENTDKQIKNVREQADVEVQKANESKRKAEREAEEKVKTETANLTKKVNSLTITKNLLENENTTLKDENQMLKNKQTKLNDELQKCKQQLQGKPTDEEISDTAKKLSGLLAARFSVGPTQGPTQGRGDNQRSDPETPTSGKDDPTDDPKTSTGIGRFIPKTWKEWLFVVGFSVVFMFCGAFVFWGVEKLCNSSPDTEQHGGSIKGTGNGTATNNGSTPTSVGADSGAKQNDADTTANDDKKKSEESSEKK